MFDALIYGALLSLGLILPLGVQNVFIFNQGATQKHFLDAMPSVLTAGLCDTILILLSVLGISVIVLALPWLKTIIFILGFFFLMYMGWLTWKSQPAALGENHEPLSRKKQIHFALSVSLLNPHALLDSVSVIGTNSLNFIGVEKIAFTFACILISFCWFFGLSIAGHFFHRLDKNKTWLPLLNKISALIMWGVAFYLLYLLFSMIAFQ